MAVNKSEAFSDTEQQLATWAKALAHPARIAILTTLAGKPCICGEIVEVLPLAQATVSQHLKELKEAGLIKGETEGPRTCYCINTEAIALLKDRFNDLIEKIMYQPNLNCDC